MNLALMVITDGRDYIWETLNSFKDTFLFDQFKYKYLIDDSLDLEFRAKIQELYPEFTVESANVKRGFGGAIQHGWSVMPEDVDYIFHLEDDFLFTKRPNLNKIIQVLEENTYLLQMALLRGPVNEQEREAGGVIEQYPDSYTENSCYTYDVFHEYKYYSNTWWREHRRFFTTNPCFYRRSLIENGWPDGPNSEGIFGIERFSENPDAKCAFWGSNQSGTWVEHIGHIRKGTGY